MFRSALFRKMLFSVLGIILAYTVILWLLSVPSIRSTIHKQEEGAATGILDSAREQVRSKRMAIDAYRAEALEWHKRELKNILLAAESLLAQRYERARAGLITEEQARRECLEDLRKLRYGNNDYIWVVDYDSIAISHPDDTQMGADMAKTKDVSGNLFIPALVKEAREKGESYQTYWWRRLGEEAPLEKLGYARDFAPGQWVMGTGVYIDDVAKEVERRKASTVQELRQMLRGVRISRTGYMFVFDSKMNMLIHPSPELEGSNISTMLDPETKRPLGEELMAAARKSDGKLVYKWDRPDDPGRYAYEKIAWVRYSPEFDWYIAASVYTDELNQSAVWLRNRILIVSGLMLVVCIVGASFFVRTLLRPVRRLSEMAARVKEGDLSVRCGVSGKDEFGLLGATLDGMVGQLQTSVEELDGKVKERTRELDEKNQKLEQEMRERVQAEKDRAELLNRQRHLLENVPAAIFLKGDDGRYVAVNRAYLAMLPTSVDDPVGKRDRDIFPPRLTSGFEEEDREVLVEGRTVQKEEPIRLRDGRVAHMSVLLTPVREAGGGITGMVGIAFDVSERKKAEEELRKAKTEAEAAKEARSMFLANMSHEIRTPMNGIIGFANLALKTDLPPTQRDYLEKIRSSADSLLGIINDILDFSKIEAGRLGIEETEFQLQRVLEEVTDLFADQAARKGIEMVIAREPQAPSALIGDPLRLRQVLVNLTSNAVKFTHQGEILVEVRRVEETPDRALLLFVVKDTGIGISEENLRKLFAPFTQADGSTTRKYGGTGLGLAISRQLVSLMGGTINIESEVGKGTTFWFELSFRKQPAGQEPPRKVSVDLRGLRTLVVDDNQTSRHVLDRMMASFGFAVASVASGQEALEELRRAAEAGAPYQLVLMDWRMPEMDGLETSKRIRNDPQVAGVPIVMITAFGRDREMEESEAIGIRAFLNKPVQQSVLFNTLMEIFGSDQRDETRTRRRIVTEDSVRATHFEGATILLVEDNAINQEVARKILGQAGILVDVANNGREAVNAVRRKAYDAVLMDVQMPEMDGYQATGVIREEARLGQLPIIAMTAHAMEGDREKCLAAGMNDYVSKPIDADLLFAVLKKWIKPRVSRRPASREQEAPGPSAAATASPAALGPLPGIDTAAALRRLGGDSDLLLRLLGDFAAGYKDAAAQIRQALQAKDTEQARALAHALKGVAGNLGAVSLEAAARDVENALRQGQIKGIEARVEEMERALSQVISSVGAFVSQERPPAAGPAEQKGPTVWDEVALKVLLGKLSARLTANDPEAEELAAAVAGHLSSRGLGEQAQQLKDRAAAFDFRGAQEILRKIAETMGISV